MRNVEIKTSVRTHIYTLLNASSIEPNSQIIPFLVKDMLLKHIHTENLHKLQLIEEARKKVELEKLHIIRSEMINAEAFSNRFSLLKFALEKVHTDGVYAEFGVYKGESINFLAEHLRKEIHGFDSFQGLPESWREGLPQGSFSIRNTARLVFSQNVKLWIGLFDETIPRFVDYVGERKIAFAHIDSDLYSSAATVFKLLGPHFGSGSVIVFDEYFGYEGWQSGEYKAFEEFIETTGMAFEYIGFNLFGEQVAVIFK